MDSTWQNLANPRMRQISLLDFLPFSWKPKTWRGIKDGSAGILDLVEFTPFKGLPLTELIKGNTALIQPAHILYVRNCRHLVSWIWISCFQWSCIINNKIQILYISINCKKTACSFKRYRLCYPSFPKLWHQITVNSFSLGHPKSAATQCFNLCTSCIQEMALK